MLFHFPVVSQGIIAGMCVDAKPSAADCNGSVPVPFVGTGKCMRVGGD